MSNSLQQKDAFLTYEANAWFQRNQQYILRFDKNADPVISLMKDYRLNTEQVLEIGCSAGHRLNGIKEEFPGATVHGIDPSSDAVQYGMQYYKDINLHVATADTLPYKDSTFDVVIIGFVLYVIDRAAFYKVIAEVDRVLKNKGCLIIIDFFSESTIKKNYHHITEFKAYSFKQNYEEVFLASHLYHLLDKSTWNHSSGNQLDASDSYNDKYYVSLLKKDLEISYKES
jgi:ubiquinone/menaquinone biosynthesis C-methylase UbiE